MHDYTGKLGVVFTKILTPEYLSERMTDREIHETVRIAKKFLSLHSPGRFHEAYLHCTEYGIHGPDTDVLYCIQQTWALFYESSYYIYVFMGVLLQAVPFLILGVLLSSALQTYVSEKWIVKLRKM